LSLGCTTLLITHDLRAAQDADLILYLSEGRIIERGTHASLMALRGEYATLFRRQEIRSSSQESVYVLEA